MANKHNYMFVSHLFLLSGVIHMIDFMDFDAAFKEVEDTPIPYVLYGETHHIPAKIPYGLVLAYSRLQDRLNDTLDFITINDIFARIFGADKVEEFAKHPDFSHDKMTQMLQWAMTKYGLKAESGEKVKRGKAQLALVSQT